MIERVSPPETIGIVGGGQLGQMLTEAAHPLGFKVIVVDPVDNCPAAQFGAEQIVAPLSDEIALTELADRSDVMTWEIEHFPAHILEVLQKRGAVVEPNPRSLGMIQDKLLQKDLLWRSGIPVAPFAEALDNQAFDKGPFVVKARFNGFDGRGNRVVDSLDDPGIAEQFGDERVYVERKLPFERELSVIMARDTYGHTVHYPVVETIHRDSICHTVVAPAEIDPDTQQAAEEIAKATMELDMLRGAGVFAIEMFDMGGGQVVVNEIAPRVHNSGHHTIEANWTSQFEQHIRAITGMSLGSVAMRARHAVMINILGTHTAEELDRTGLHQVLQLPDVHPHFYGKTPRSQRKIGHITLLGDDKDILIERANHAREELTEL